MWCGVVFLVARFEGRGGEAAKRLDGGWENPGRLQDKGGGTNKDFDAQMLLISRMNE